MLNAAVRTISLPGRASDFDIGPLLDTSYVRDTDVVVLSGSIVEGIGTECSDLDLYVIGDALPSSEVVDWARHDWVTTSAGASSKGTAQPPQGVLREIFDYVENSRLGWNVEYWTSDEVARLIAQASATYRESLTHTHTLGSWAFSYKERMLLHRFHIGHAMQNEARFAEIMAEFDPVEFCYVSYRQHAGGYADFRDIVGLWHAGDFDTAWLTAHNHVTDQLFAFTFLTLDTNPSRKWIYRKLARLPDRFQRMARAYRALFGAEIDRRDKEHTILASLDLLDDICRASIELLDTHPKFLSTRDSLRLTRDEFVCRGGARAHGELVQQYLYREKLYRADLPPFRDFLLPDALERCLEFARRDPVYS
jgi:hypothetical protein